MANNANAGLRITTNERDFIEAAIKEDHRIDGRTPFDYRKLHIKFLREDGSVEVQLGQTRVLAVVKGEITQPYPDRGNEGSLAIYTEFSPMGDPAFELGRPSEMAVELGRIIDRGLRESRAVDTESLCILSGRSVWAIRVDIHILDNYGNLVDAANLAALAALLSYRRPECTVGGEDGQQVIVHPPEVREPVGLIIHHIPIAVTFAFFGDGNFQVLDPSLKEEEVMGGRITITINSQGEICAVQKGGGVGVSASELMRCIRIASSKAQSITETLKKAVEVHEIERAQRKIRRHRNLPTELEAEVEMEEAPEAPMASDPTEPEQAMDTERDINDERMSDANQLESNEIKIADAQVKKSSRAAGEKDIFAGGESAWGDDAKLTPLKGAPGTRSSFFPLDSDALVEFDVAAKAVLRGGVSSQRMSSKVVSAPLQRQISGQIAAAAVYANQSSAHIAEEARSLGPIFPRVADMDSTEGIVSVEGTDAELGVLGNSTLETELVNQSEDKPLNFLSSGKKKAKKRKSGGVRQN
ncbi:hypothetical protein M758_7G094400 [Ceratodon purpureus]|nr:hypothetical protein M758_7G094400 [Ceratodon purpureus]